MPRAWSRADAVLTMAVFLDRPPRLQAPPPAERERLASILRRDLGEVNLHVGHFVALERGDDPGCLDQQVWASYRDDPPALWEEADRVMAGRKGVPRHLRRRTGGG